MTPEGRWERAVQLGTTSDFLYQNQMNPSYWPQQRPFFFKPAFHTTRTTAPVWTARLMSHYKAGLPLVLFVAGGSFALSKFVEGKVDAKDLRTKSLTERQFNLEEEHAAISRKLNGELESFEITRIPRNDD